MASVCLRSSIIVEFNKQDTPIYQFFTWSMLNRQSSLYSLINTQLGNWHCSTAACGGNPGKSSQRLYSVALFWFILVEISQVISCQNHVKRLMFRFLVEVHYSIYSCSECFCGMLQRGQKRLQDHWMGHMTTVPLEFTLPSTDYTFCCIADIHIQSMSACRNKLFH